VYPKEENIFQWTSPSLGERAERGGGWSFVSLGVAALAITGLLPTVSQVAINDDDVAQRSGH